MLARWHARVDRCRLLRPSAVVVIAMVAVHFLVSSDAGSPGVDQFPTTRQRHRATPRSMPGGMQVSFSPVSAFWARQRPPSDSGRSWSRSGSARRGVRLLPRPGQMWSIDRRLRRILARQQRGLARLPVGDARPSDQPWSGRPESESAELGRACRESPVALATSRRASTVDETHRQAHVS